MDWEDEIVVHENPVWRKDANFILRAPIVSDERKNKQWKWEQLWVKKLDEDMFKVCCIPFFIYDLSLGDEVSISRAADGSHVLNKVIKSAGRYTFRVWFHTEKAKAFVEPKLRSMGCLLEWRYKGSNLLAVDAETTQIAEEASGLLMDYENQGFLEYETGRII